MATGVCVIPVAAGELAGPVVWEAEEAEGGDLIVFILFFFFPADLTGARFFLFFPDLVTGPVKIGDAPNSSSGPGASSSSLGSSEGVWKAVSVDSTDSFVDS